MQADAGEATAGCAAVVEATRLRETMANVAASVAILTVDLGDRVRGVTISSLISVSLDPPLILFALHQASSILPHLEFGDFGLTVLAEDQHAIASTLADRGRVAVPDEWLCRSGHDERLRIRKGSAWFDARLQALHPAGDHVIVVGLVIRSGHSGRAPLLHYRRSYRAIEPAVAATSRR